MDNCGMYYVRNLKNSPMMRLLMNDVLYASRVLGRSVLLMIDECYLSIELVLCNTKKKKINNK